MKECYKSSYITGSLFKDIFHGGIIKNRGLVSSVLPKSKGWDDSQKRFKLLMLHFLVHVLLVAPIHAPIQNMSWTMFVEDLDEFNNHPWGNVAWNFFRGQVRKYVEKIGTNYDSTKKINFPGFHYPL